MPRRWGILAIRRMGTGAKSDLMATDGALTPAMRQHRAAKEQYPDTLLFFRMGDFYELFFEDAVVAARELELTLTARDKLKQVPMCGVPYHAVEVYLQRLLRRGYRVAICEQMEDPKLAKGVVKREVTRVLTPGTAIDPGLEGAESCWLAAVAQAGSGDGAVVGLAMIDLSTGEFRVTEFAGQGAWGMAADELGRLRPVELLYPGGGLSSQSSRRSAMLRFGQKRGDPAGLDAAAQDDVETGLAGLEAIRTKTPIEDWVFTTEHAVPLLQRQFGVQSMDGLGLAGHASAAAAAGAVLEYLKRTRQGALEHVDSVRFYERSTCLQLDAVSVRNLELIDPLFSAEGVETTLFRTMDACLTPMGKRLLRAILLRPMSGAPEIDARLDAVAEASGDVRRREDLRRSLDGLLDLERLLARVALDSAGPREVVALAATISRLPALLQTTSAMTTARWQELATGLDVLPDVLHRITRTLAEEPPVSLADGGAIRAEVSAELDELRELQRSGRGAIAAIEERERARTGIGSLKVRFNQVFGYYIEVTKANARAAPPDYERKQTLVNAERFTTPELKDLERKILTAEDRSGEIERRLFAELRSDVLATASRIRATARRVAEIDLLGCFAHLAALHGWVRPIIENSGVLEVAAGRHPVVERRMVEGGLGRFVPNSLFVEAGSDGPGVLLITGPNMGGKSTYLRMAALLVIMAQSGSFVPAERLRLGLVDRVYTRIGASDNVARGRSTFMVEMTETAAILNTATDRSLVLLDEMGRGTATYDGLSLAWSVVEYLHDSIGARTLFATHYHELTMLEDRLSRLKNVRVTVKETAGGIVFLHAVEAGAASKSYGIEVARLAGIPAAVIGRAREVLRVHERAETQQVREATPTVAGAREPAMQMTMLTPLSQRIVDRIAAADVDGMTPREALALVAELQRELQP